MVRLRVMARVKLSREDFSALGAATGQHLAAILGGHARTEPVTALTDKLARLVRTFHGHGVTPSFLGGCLVTVRQGLVKAVQNHDKMNQES